MYRVVKISKGLDIKLKGAPVKEMTAVHIIRVTLIHYPLQNYRNFSVFLILFERNMFFCLKILYIV